MTDRKDVPLRAFKLTVSTKEPVDECDERILTKWISSQFQMYHIVAEHGASGKRHLHALLCSEHARIKRNIADTVWKKIKDRHPTSKQGIAVRVDVLYDSTWYEEYLSKEDGHEVIASNYDASRENGFYPTDEQQEYLQSVKSRSTIADPFYASLDDKFTEWWTKQLGAGRRQPTYDDTAKFLEYSYYDARSLRVCSDVRRVKQIARSLCKYHNRDGSIDHLLDRELRDMDGIFRGN